MIAIVKAQPENSNSEEISKFLTFDRMIKEGIEDSKKENVFSEAEALERIKTWQKHSAITSLKNEK